jgi:hypothetical protein
MLSYIIVEHSPMGTVLGIKAVPAKDIDDYVFKNGDCVICITNQPNDDRVTIVSKFVAYHQEA